MNGEIPRSFLFGNEVKEYYHENGTCGEINPKKDFRSCILEKHDENTMHEDIDGAKW